MLSQSSTTTDFQSADSTDYYNNNLLNYPPQTIVLQSSTDDTTLVEYRSSLRLRKNNLFTVTTPFYIDGESGALNCNTNISIDIVVGVILGVTVLCWLPLLIGEVALLALFIFIVLHISQKGFGICSEAILIGKCLLCGDETLEEERRERAERIRLLMEATSSEIKAKKAQALIKPVTLQLNMYKIAQKKSMTGKMQGAFLVLTCKYIVYF